MKRLSLLDALFLYLETPETPMHVGSAEKSIGLMLEHYKCQPQDAR